LYRWIVNIGFGDTDMSASASIERKGYSAAQIGLHWVIAILLATNVLFTDEGMSQAWRAYERNSDASGLSGFVPQVHLWVGVAVLAFALYRLFLRRTRGVPAAPAEESAVLRLAAHATHILLYTLMIVIPATGLAVYYLGIEFAGEIHESMRLPLIGLVLLHVGGALYQRFILKTNVLTRIVRPEA
jgi:cytochrome b561